MSAMTAAQAQTVATTRYNVRDIVEISVPEHWRISDSQARDRVAKLAAEQFNLQNNEPASFVATSVPPPSRAYVRVKFLPVDPPLTQERLRRMSDAQKQELIAAVRNEFESDVDTLAAMASKGMRLVNRPVVSLEPFGQQTAIVTRYGRTSTVDAKDTMLVAIYQVVLGDVQAMVTFSNIEGDVSAKAANDAIRQSIVVRPPAAGARR